MDRQDVADWDEDRWEAEFEILMEDAKRHTPDLEKPEVIALKTMKDNVYTVVIPDFLEAENREKREDACIDMLLKKDDTEVFCCVAVLQGKSIEIPSWDFRKRLLEIDQRNEDSELLLQGFGTYIVKQLKHTMPPK